MAKRISLNDIVISSPKSVIKPVVNEQISCILPKYYTTLYDISIGMSNNDKFCWFCNQLIVIPLYIETLKGRQVGNFCSHICRDSFASMIKPLVALREEPKISLLPLVVYDKPDEVINIINLLRNKEGVYGSSFYRESDKSINISLRSLL
ncbi:viral late transcription factor VLTF-2 [Brazilian porcupinepox virus 1]|nr:viral late transcription factor VLTF-2 [Brazilian porcupinepox virus 1]